MPEIRQLRERADKDRPYLLAVCGVIDEWSDAEEQYDHAIKTVEAAQRELDKLRENPDADPLDIASAKLDVRLWSMWVPDTSPSRAISPGARRRPRSPRASRGWRRPHR